MLSTQTDALLLASVARYRRFDGYTAVEVPSRRDFWYGHALILDREPAAEDQATWIARHAEHFRGIDVRRHTIVWEVMGERERAPVLGPNVRGEIQRSIVFARRTPYGTTVDARVRPLASDADWDAAAALSALEDAEASPEMRDFGHWRFGIVRSDATNARMRMWGIWDGDELAAFAGIYASPTLARFTTPVTRAVSRPRTLSCALRDRRRCDVARISGGDDRHLRHGRRGTGNDLSSPRLRGCRRDVRPARGAGRSDRSVRPSERHLVY